MNLRDKIWEWAEGLDDWQNDLLRRIYESGELDEKELKEVRENLLATLLELDLPHDVVRLQKDQIQTAISDEDPVRIKKLSDLKNVGTLSDDGALSFLTDGLTIIYGENGAGKSSYARVLKKACRAMKQMAEEQKMIQAIIKEEIDQLRNQIEKLERKLEDFPQDDTIYPQVSALTFETDVAKVEALKGLNEEELEELEGAEKDFSVNHAYPKLEYPVLEIEGEKAKCVLCQQTLNEDGIEDRLKRFEKYITDDIEKRLKEKRTQRNDFILEIEQLKLTDLLTNQTRNLLDEQNPELLKSIDAIETTLSRVKKQTEKALKEEKWDNEIREEIKNGTDSENKIKLMIKGWYELLRESWERAVEELVLGDVINRFRFGVATTYLKRVNVSDEIIKELDAQMTHCSDQAHDQAPERNNPIPDISDMEDDINTLKEFRKKLIN